MPAWWSEYKKFDPFLCRHKCSENPLCKTYDVAPIHYADVDDSSGTIYSYECLKGSTVFSHGWEHDSEYSTDPNEQWYGTLEEASAKCTKDQQCEYLHDMNKDNKNWRVCKTVDFRLPHLATSPTSPTEQSTTDGGDNYYAGVWGDPGRAVDGSTNATWITKSCTMTNAEYFSPFKRNPLNPL